MRINHKSEINLLKGDIGKKLLKLAVPMMIGLVAIMLFNVVDTFYVGKLGAKPLAAMGFIFPITWGILSLSFGIGIGASSVISRFVGKGNHKIVKRIATDSLFLALIIVAIIASIGFFTIKRAF
jgi:Na+-driven multidrug efflux pump